jgi:hypothetical protein
MQSTFRWLVLCMHQPPARASCQLALKHVLGKFPPPAVAARCLAPATAVPQFFCSSCRVSTVSLCECRTKTSSTMAT